MCVLYEDIYNAFKYIKDGLLVHRAYVLYELQYPSHDCHVGCNLAVQELCFILSMQPMTSSGDHHLVHSWWLLGAVLVSVKVIMG